MPPVNYVGDFGGGGMMLAYAMVVALLGVKLGRGGQVVDAAMTDGSALLAGMTYAFHGAGMWRDEPGANLLDGAAHFYDTYECADGKFVAIGSIEPQFYSLLLATLGLADDPAFGAQMDPRAWPDLKARLSAIFRTKSRDEWASIMDGTDICFAPVLSLAEAPDHPHNVARGTFVEVAGQRQPAPAPRYSAAVLDEPRAAREDTDALLAELGLDAGELRARGAVG